MAKLNKSCTIEGNDPKIALKYNTVNVSIKNKSCVQKHYGESLGDVLLAWDFSITSVIPQLHPSQVQVPFCYSAEFKKDDVPFTSAVLYMQKLTALPWL